MKTVIAVREKYDGDIGWIHAVDKTIITTDSDSAILRMAENRIAALKEHHRNMMRLLLEDVSSQNEWKFISKLGEECRKKAETIRTAISKKNIDSLISMLELDVANVPDDTYVVFFKKYGHGAVATYSEDRFFEVFGEDIAEMKGIWYGAENEASFSRIVNEKKAQANEALNNFLDKGDKNSLAFYKQWQRDKFDVEGAGGYLFFHRMHEYSLHYVCADAGNGEILRTYNVD